MPQYRKKPIIIEAFRLGALPLPDWFKVALQEGIAECVGDDATLFYVNIMTLEGVMTAQNGDWIIKGIKSEIYPCKHDIFEMTYEAVV